jgi:hypothetical protein
MKRQHLPKEVDEYAETEVLDRSVLESIDRRGDVGPAADYDEYSRLLAGEDGQAETEPKPARKRSR